jgi:hypothetical protein
VFDDGTVIYGEKGPLLEDSGNCVGDVGCEVFNNNKTSCKYADDGSCVGDVGCEDFDNDEDNCRDTSDDLNCVWDEQVCYWGEWENCSGDAIVDCNGKPSGQSNTI